MKALSVRQPWAWLIAMGWKDVENREWYTNYRGRILIHASKSRDDMCKEVIAAVLRRLDNRQGGEFMLAYQNIPEPLAFGAFIGEVDIVDWRLRKNDAESNLFSKWHEVGQYGLYLANAVMYPEPIPYCGRLGLFEVEL